MTETPLPPPIYGPVSYGVQWKLTKGYAVANGNKLQRDPLGFPIVPADDDESETEVSYFHTEYEWKSVKLEYNAVNEKGVKPLIGYSIKAQVFSYRTKTTKPDLQSEEETTIEVLEFPEDFAIRSTITSHDPNSSGTWVYPDDYDVIEPPTYPTRS